MARRIAVAFNDDLHRKAHLSEIERVGEAESGETAREIADLLGAAIVPVGDDVRAALRRMQSFDVVVNLCEGVLGRPHWEMHFALALEMLGIPFTGADPVAVGICVDKRLTKQILRARGIRTPVTPSVSEGPGWRGGIGIFAPPGPPGPSLPLGATTWIVKPSLEDAGIGIEPASIVHDEDELRARVKYVETKYRQPALVEEFIDGRELNQAIFLGRPLPPGEIVFDERLEKHERVVGWKAKWAAGSAEDQATVNRTPAQIENKEEVARLCLDAYHALGINGYARFDLREAKNGELYIVDVNPNPDIGRGSGFRLALEADGIAFADFLDALIIAAGERRPA